MSSSRSALSGSRLGEAPKAPAFPQFKASNEAAMSDDVAHEAQEGRLTHKTRGDVKACDLYENVTNIQDLFGSLQGAALLEKTLSFYQVDERDIPWYSDDGSRTVVRSELSRPIQQATVSRYQARIYKEGLSQMVSGHALHCSVLSCGVVATY